MAVKYLSKLQFKDCRCVHVLHMTEMPPDDTFYNKPIYVGTLALYLSKLFMMGFHYNVTHKTFAGRYNLIYSDTDSFTYSMQHEDIYKRDKEHSTYLDLSESIKSEIKDNAT